MPRGEEAVARSEVEAFALCENETDANSLGLGARTLLASLLVTSALLLVTRSY